MTPTLLSHRAEPPSAPAARLPHSLLSGISSVLCSRHGSAEMAPLDSPGTARLGKRLAAGLVGGNLRNITLFSLAKRRLRTRPRRTRGCIWSVGTGWRFCACAVGSPGPEGRKSQRLLILVIAADRERAFFFARYFYVFTLHAFFLKFTAPKERRWGYPPGR